MSPEFVQFIFGQSGIGALAAFALWLLDRTYKDALRREKEMNEQLREDRRQLIAVLGESARSNMALQATIESMSKELAYARVRSSSETK